MKARACTIALLLAVAACAKDKGESARSRSNEQSAADERQARTAELQVRVEKLLKLRARLAPLREAVPEADSKVEPKRCDDAAIKAKYGADPVVTPSVDYAVLSYWAGAEDDRPTQWWRKLNSAAIQSIFRLDMGPESSAAELARTSGNAALISGYNLDALLSAPYALVVRSETRRDPQLVLEDNTYEPGYLAGRLYLVDVEAGNVACHVSITVEGGGTLSAYEKIGDVAGRYEAIQADLDDRYLEARDGALERIASQLTVSD